MVGKVVKTLLKRQFYFWSHRADSNAFSSPFLTVSLEKVPANLLYFQVQALSALHAAIHSKCAMREKV